MQRSALPVGPARRLGIGFLALAAVAFGGARGVPAQQLTGRAILSWQEFDSDGQSSSGFRQQYDLDLEKSVSEPTRYHLWLRARDSDDRFGEGEERTASDFQQLETGGDLRFSLPSFQAQARFSSLLSSFGGVQAAERRIDNGRGVLSWRFDAFPDLTLLGETSRISDDRDLFDERQERVQAALSDLLGPFRYSLTLSSTEFDDGSQGAMRDTVDLQLNASYNDSFWEGRLSTSAQLLVLDSELEESSSSPAGARLREEIEIFEAATGIDETPLDARDRPLESEPRLVDGLFSPFGLAVGPTGRSALNVALDLGRLAEVAEIRLYVRDASGDLVPAGGPLQWQPYVSDDQLDWFPLLGARQRFDATQSLYEVTFEPTATRFVKLVSFGLNVVETELVEVEAFEIRVVAPGETSISDRQFTSARTSIAARPAEWVDLSWRGLWNSSRRQPRGGEEDRTDDSDHVLTVRARPSSWSDVEVLYQRRTQDPSNGARREFELWRAGVTFVPKAGLDLSVEGLRSTDDSLDRRVETNGFAIKSHATLWRAIDLRLDLGKNESEFVDEGRTVSRTFANGWLIAWLTDALQLTASLTLAESDLEEDLPPQGVPALLPDDRRWTFEAYWRPGPPLALTARVGRASSGDFSTTIRRINLQWTPFRQGAIRLEILYDQDIDTFSRRTFQRLGVSPTWVVNRRTTLTARYTLFDFDGAVTSRQRSATVDLIVRL